MVNMLIHHRRSQSYKQYYRRESILSFYLANANACNQTPSSKQMGFTWEEECCANNSWKTKAECIAF